MIDVVALRREFHKYPELAFTEFRTASRVVEILKTLNYKVLYGPDAMEASSRLKYPSDNKLANAREKAIRDGAKREIVDTMRDGLTAVVGILKGSVPGPTLAFHFDMDAVPVEESTEVDHIPFKENFMSQYEGSMHACGHDAHTAIGLALASRMGKRDFPGTIKLIFQPAEEGGRGGARSIAEKGVLDDVDQIYCFHVAAGSDLGTIVAGIRYLATTKLEAEFFGVPAHSASAPEKGRNALLGAASALLNIHAIPSFSKNEVRLNVGMLQGGTAVNIVPAYAKMSIETRATTSVVNEELVERVKRIIRCSAEMYQLKYDVTIIGEATSFDSDPELINIVMEVANKLDYHSVIRSRNSNGSEDASYLIQRVQKHGGKGTYLTVGSRFPHPHHNTRFDIDEEVLPKTVNLLEKIARTGFMLNGSGQFLQGDLNR